MSTKIDPNFQPSERVYELLAPLMGTIERAREFVGHEIGAFIMYWEGREDKGATKANWNSTCLNWMKRTYEDKRHQMAQHRTYGKRKDNVIQEVVGTLMGVDMDSPPKRNRRPPRIVVTAIPGEGQTMSQADALAALAEMSK